MSDFSVMPTNIVDSPENASEALRLDERLQLVEFQMGKHPDSATATEIAEIKNRILMKRITASGYIMFLVVLALMYKRLLDKIVSRNDG